MKALRCTALTGIDALEVHEMPSQPVGPRQVRARVAAAALNFYDMLMTEGRYQYKADPPFTPGSEAAGEVVEVGAEVTRFKPGDRVATSSTTGAFAEEQVIDEAACVPLPDGLAFETAAAMRATYGTSYYCLKERGQLQAGDTLAVTGAAGGVGLAAVELGRMMGARVIGTVGSDAKKDIVLKYGAEACLNHETEDLRAGFKEFGGKDGITVGFDTVGGDKFEPLLRAMGWYGRLVIVGFTSGEIPKAAMNLPLLKSCSIVGAFWGAWTDRNPEKNREMVGELFQFAADGKLRPHVGLSLPLAEAREGYRALAERRTTGKVLFTMG